ncbi:MAG: glycerol-3-phosphate dehydrogenase [Parvibaculaceae bacterium]
MGVESDLLIIGGGINGCGIARDAAGRGLSVLLYEKEDLASGTSSASTKLIHGGLRYLEHYEFRLVRESLIEREVLLRSAPHIIWPLRFVLPHHEGLRPQWLLRIGLFLYDHIGGRDLLPGTRSLDLAGGPLKPQFTQGFEYSDCWVEDSRLVVLNAIDARERGARILTRTEVVGARRGPEAWTVTLRDTETGRVSEAKARALVNAAGPWAGRVLTDIVRGKAGATIRLVKGSHIIVRRLYDHDRCYIFQNRDGRIVFSIPYEGDFTLIGTTDVDFRGDLETVEISEEERSYLCDAASEYFARPVRQDDIVHTYAGVRPLYDDGQSEASSLTRDYVLDLDTAGGAPVLNIFGGKITTFRKLAEAALEKLQPLLRFNAGPWTESAPLPGGDFPVDGFQGLVERVASACSGMAPSHARRLARAYGTRAFALLDGVRRLEDMGARFGADFYEREARYLMENEWARTAGDMLWRRSKLGLRFGAEERRRFMDWLGEDAAAAPAA